MYEYWGGWLSPGSDRAGEGCAGHRIVVETGETSAREGERSTVVIGDV